MDYFRMSSLQDTEPVGTIQVRRPIRSLGRVTDIHGKNWDVHCITSGGVSACPEEKLHSYYTDTSGQSWGGGTIGSNMINQRWDAYRVEVIPA